MNENKRLASAKLTVQHYLL